MGHPTSGDVVVAPATTDEELLELIGIRRVVDRDSIPTLAGLEHTLATFRHARFFLARLDGVGVGTGVVAGFPGGDDGPRITTQFDVIRAARGKGVGSALYRAVSDHAHAAGKEGLTVEAKEDDGASLAWLERRGFVEVERQKAVELDLSTAEIERPSPPEGVVVVSRAERSGFELGMYRVGVEAGRDIPGLDGEDEPPTFADWRSFEIERPSRRPELCFVALVDDEVVGFASLDVFGDPKKGDHGLTAVARAWRRRGVGEALKRAQIQAAHDAGLERLATESVEENEPMRRLNEKLGFLPVVGMVVLEGPLAARI